MFLCVKFFDYLFFTDFFVNSLNPETKTDYVIKNKSNAYYLTIYYTFKNDELKFDYLSNSQKRLT